MRALLLLSLACGDADKTAVNAECADAYTSPDIDWDCDPIDPSRCILPFPSTFFMEENADMVSGWQVALGDTTIPKNIDLVQPDPVFYNEKALIKDNLLS